MGILIVCKGADFSDCAVDRVEIPTCNHIYGAGVVTKTPTCAEDGIITYTCTICGATRAEIVPATAHTYVDGVCAVCGKKDPTLPKAIEDYPVQYGLQGLYDFGGTEAASLANHAQNPTYLPDGGTPRLNGSSYAVEEKYVSFSGAAKDATMLTYLRLPLSGGLTYVALFRVPYSAGGALRERPIISSKSSATPNLSLTNAHVLFAKNNLSVNNVVFDGGAINSDNFIILAMTADANGFKVVRYTNGALANIPLIVDDTKVNAYEGVIDSWTTNAIQIGGNTTSVAYAAADISLAAIHTGKLTDEQLEQVCEFVYDYGVQKHGEKSVE